MKRVSFKDDLTSVGTSPPPSLHESEYASMWYTGQQLRNFRAEAKEIRRNPKAFDPTQDCWRGLEVYVSRRKEVQTSRQIYSRSMLASLQQHQQQHQRRIQEQQRNQQNAQFHRTTSQEKPPEHQEEAEQPYNCFQRFVEPNALRQLAVQQSRVSAEQAVQEATRDYLEALKLYRDEASDEEATKNELSLARLRLDPIKESATGTSTTTTRQCHSRGQHRWRTGAGLRARIPPRHILSSGSAAALTA